MEKIKIYLNNYLDSKKLTEPVKKVIMFNGVFIFFGLLFALTFFSVNHWFFWLFIGASLTFLNFFFMAISVQKSININEIYGKNLKNIKLKHIFLSYLRLFISGIFLYTCLVYWEARPIALSLGLAIPLFNIPMLLIIFRK